MPLPPSRPLICLLFFTSITLTLSFLGCSASQRFKSDGIETHKSSGIRILLNEPSGELQFVTGEDLILYADGKELPVIKKGVTVDFILVKGKLRYSGSSETFSEYKIKPINSYFNHSNKQLSGDIRIISDGKYIYLINTIPLEEYLKGVVPSEMPLGRGNEYFEGLKAFTICARTYALKRIMDSKGIFDVRTDVRDQVYGGEGRRQKISDNAVEETRGLILSYENKPATIFYSSTCGGYTEDAGNVFGIPNVPYLRTIKDGNDPWCSVSPRINWEEQFTPQRIISLLKRGNKITHTDYKLSGMKINSRFSSGRVNELELILESRKEGRVSVKLYGNNVRFVLLDQNNGTLRSNNFELTRSGDNYKLTGRGWGHGVGLCQWGTLSQSSKGISYEKILHHYFPGTAITSIYD